jgi:hypothetical protein
MRPVEYHNIIDAELRNHVKYIQFSGVFQDIALLLTIYFGE